MKILSKDSARIVCIKYATAFCLLSLSAVAQNGFDRTAHEQWLKEERPNWSDEDRATLLDVMESQYANALQTLPRETADLFRDHAPDFAMAQLPPEIQSATFIDIFEEKYRLSIEACANRPPLTPEQQKNLDDQMARVERAARQATDEIASALDNSEEQAEFQGIAEDRMAAMKRAAASPFFTTFKSPMEPATLDAMLQKITDRAASSLQDLEEEDRLPKEERMDRTTLLNILASRISASTEGPPPKSERLHELNQKLHAELTALSVKEEERRWQERDKRNAEEQAAFDIQSTRLNEELAARRAALAEPRPSPDAALAAASTEIQPNDGSTGDADLAKDTNAKATNAASVAPYILGGMAVLLVVVTGVAWVRRGRQDDAKRAGSHANSR